jgi:acyl-CoA thioesterase-2
MTVQPSDKMASGTLVDLLAVLDLESVGPDRFRGHSPDGTAERVFGGQVAAQAVIAAGRTVTANRELATVQATFLRAGNPRASLDFEVTRPADGRTFAFRQVTVRQHDRAIFTFAATFHAGEPGPTHGDCSGPIDALSFPHYEPDVAPLTTGAYELRRQAAGPTGDPMILAFRTTGRLGDDPLLHAALAVHASDLFILEVALDRHGLNGIDDDNDCVSIDHAMWFHSVPRIDEWVVNRLVSPVAQSGRTLVRAEMRDECGALLVTVAQHGLLRWAHR